MQISKVCGKRHLWAGTGLHLDQALIQFSVFHAFKSGEKVIKLPVKDWCSCIRAYPIDFPARKTGSGIFAGLPYLEQFPWRCSLLLSSGAGVSQNGDGYITMLHLLPWRSFSLRTWRVSSVKGKFFANRCSMNWMSPRMITHCDRCFFLLHPPDFCIIMHQWKVENRFPA